MSRPTQESGIDNAPGRRGETVYDVIVDVKINDSGRAAIGRGP